MAGRYIKRERHKGESHRGSMTLNIISRQQHDEIILEQLNEAKDSIARMLAARQLLFA